jgi:predicted nucleic acid-binding Zn finger protein
MTKIGVNEAYRNLARAVIDSALYVASVSGSMKFFKSDTMFDVLYAPLSGYPAEDIIKGAEERICNRPKRKRSRVWNNVEIRVFFENGETKDFISIIAASEYLGCKERFASLAHNGKAPRCHVLYTKKHGRVALFDISDAPTSYDFSNVDFFCQEKSLGTQQ